MKKTESTYNPNTSQGSYSHKMHHRELVVSGRVINDAPPAYQQKLDAEIGLQGAVELLADRYQNEEKEKA